MSSQAENLARWFANMVEAGEFKNPLPFPLFSSTVRKRCKSDSQFYKFAQDVRNALLKHNITVARVVWNAYQPQQQQNAFDPCEQTLQQEQETVQQQQYSLVLNAHDDNSTFKLIAWLYNIIGKARNNEQLKQLCFSVDFKEA